MPRAGVSVQEANFLSYSAPPPGLSNAAFVGSHYQGPVNLATFCTSWPDFVQKFGGFSGVNAPSNLQLAVYTFFQNGGSNCWVVRATGTGIAKATVTLQDASPANVATFTALNEGVWGNSISLGVQTAPNVLLPPTTVSTTSGASPQSLPGASFVVVSTTGFTASGTLQVVTTANGVQTLTYTSITNSTTFGGVTGGTGSVPAGAAVSQAQVPSIPAFTLQVYYGGTSSNFLVETWTNLTMNPSSPSYFVNVLNSASTGSNWISAAAVGTPTTVPAAFLASAGTGALTGGNDGAAIGTGGYTTANGANGQAANGFLNALDVVNGPLVLNLPNVTPVAGGTGTTTDINNAIGYAANRQDVFVVVDCPQGQTPPTTGSSGIVGSAGAAVALNPSTTGLAVDPKSFGAMYYPWITIVDPVNNKLPGQTRTVAPGGFISGQMVKTDLLRGVFKAPAGMQAALSGAVGVEFTLTNADLDALYSGNAGATSPTPAVNPIRKMPGAGIVVWGARTLSSDQTVKFVPVRRTLIYLRSELLARTQFAVFEPNDGILWNNIASVLGQFLGSFWQSGGLVGQTSAEAYYVQVDSSNNTPTTVANGEVHVDVGVAVQRPAEFIIIRLGQWQSGQSSATILG